MSRVVVIGATGHVGSYLVPGWWRAARGHRDQPRHPRPLPRAPEWDAVTRLPADRDAVDAAGTFGAFIAGMGPDVVIDMVCFTADSARQLVDALRPSRPLLIHCGTIWVHGPALVVPVTEDEPRTAYGEYGTGKAAIEALLHARDPLRRGALGRAASRPHQRPRLAGHHPGRQPGPGRLDRARRGPPAGPARPRPGRAAPRARRRRGPGLRARPQLRRRDRVQLPRGRRAGHDPARAGRRSGLLVRPRAGPGVRRLGRVRPAGWAPGTPRRPGSTPSAASPPASTGPARCSAMRRGTPRCRPCTRHWAGWRQRPGRTSAASDSRSTRRSPSTC